MNILQKMIKNDKKYPFLGHYVQVLGRYVQVFLSHKKWLNHAGLRVYGTLAQNFLQTNCDKKINKYKRFIKFIEKCPNLYVKQIFDKPFIFTLLRKTEEIDMIIISAIIATLLTAALLMVIGFIFSAIAICVANALMDFFMR